MYQKQAFDPGKTALIRGVEAAFDLARDWAPGSTTFILMTDGDTVGLDSSGFPRAPRSLGQFLIAGLGTRRGAFIDGHQSRQDSGTLQFMASRFRGVYEDVNIRHFPTQALAGLVSENMGDDGMKWTRKQTALMACGSGAILLALLPALLEFFGFNLTRQLALKQQLYGGTQA